jgi:3-isopropylmalate/(R)-2-methylmalate dehydratase small subunit
VDDQTVTYAGGVARFDIDEEVKHRMTNGLDDIAVTLGNVAVIDAFESSGAADLGPVTTSL